MEDNSKEIMERLFVLAKEHPERFYIVEAQIDVNTQLEYFEQSANARKEKEDLEINDIEKELYKDDISEDSLKEVIIKIASCESVEAYRLIEKYIENPNAPLKEWAMMAYNELRMVLETSFLEKSRVFISSGMGREANPNYVMPVAFILLGGNAF